MKLGYNTNGLQCHDWRDALTLIAETGFQSVGLTLDHACLNPYSADFPRDREQLKAMLQELQLSCVIETGARFLLDPRHRHEPTLVSSTAEGRARRVDFLRRAIDLAADIGAEAVSFWSGIVRDDAAEETVWDRLVTSCRQVLAHAEQRQVRLAFEPEPGMFLDTMARWDQLQAQLDNPWWGLTLDIGHIHCLETDSIPAVLHRWRDRLWNVHLEDMHRGVHEHLRFGEGSIDFPPVLQALRDIDYRGCVNVELSRHSHIGVEVLQESFAFLSCL